MANPLGARSIAQQMAVQCACANLAPSSVASVVQNTIMRPLPLARRHLNHYLHGRGADLPVDLAGVIRRDRGVREKLATHIRAAGRGHFKVNQSDYAVTDFQFAFGAIDRLDYEVNRTAGTVHLWCKDRYEWHPVGPGYRRFPDDGVRPSNCVHAAMVELKSSGAADYWMVGDAVLPLSSVVSGPAGTRTPRPIRSPAVPLESIHVTL